MTATIVRAHGGVRGANLDPDPANQSYLDEGYLSIADNGGMSAPLIVMAVEYIAGPADGYISYGCYITGKCSGYEIRFTDNRMVAIPVTSVLGP